MTDSPFTPRTRDGVRHKWASSVIKGGYKDIRGYGYRFDAVVKGKRYRVYGADCGLGGSDCICDAVALDLKKDESLILALDELTELGVFPE